MTVTVTDWPGATVAVAGETDSHSTSAAELPQSSKPGRTSLSTVAVKPPEEPPIFAMPHAMPPR